MELKELKDASDALFPACGVEEVNALERELKLRLPRPFRALLLAQNGMLFSQGLDYPVPPNIDPDANALIVLFGVGDASESRSILGECLSYDFEERVPPNIIPIGENSRPRGLVFVLCWSRHRKRVPLVSWVVLGRG